MNQSMNESMNQSIDLLSTWLRYCRYGVKLYAINLSTIILQLSCAFYDVCDFVNDLIAIYRSQEVVRQIGEHGFTVKGFGAIKHVTVIHFSWSYLKSRNAFLTEMFKLFDWRAKTGYENIFYFEFSNSWSSDKSTNNLTCGDTDMTREYEYLRSRHTDLAMGGRPMSS